MGWVVLVSRYQQHNSMFGDVGVRAVLDANNQYENIKRVETIAERAGET